TLATFRLSSLGPAPTAGGEFGRRNAGESGERPHGVTTAMPTCVYIASPSFSGSTVLAMLLGRHPEIATIGEMKGGQEDLATYACSCGTRFIKCPFWASLIAALGERGFVYDLSDRRTMPAFRMPGSSVGDRFMRSSYRSAGFELLRDLVLHYWPGCSSRLQYLRRYNQTF